MLRLFDKEVDCELLPGEGGIGIGSALSVELLCLMVDEVFTNLTLLVDLSSLFWSSDELFELSMYSRLLGETVSSKALS